MQKLSHHMTAYLPAIALLGVAVLFSVGLLVTKNAGSIGLQSVAVFPPWWSQQESFASIAGTGTPIAAPGPFEWMVVVVPQSAQQAQNLQSSRALFLLNSEFARLCGAAPAQHITMEAGPAT